MANGQMTEINLASCSMLRVVVSKVGQEQNRMQLPDQMMH